MTRTLRILVAVAILLMAIGAGTLAVLTLAPQAQQRIGNALGGAIGGPFRLTASDGSTVTDATYRGKWMLIYFGFTSCPDACPTALNNIGVALDRLGPKDAAVLQPIFITVDPKRDTPQVLGEYLKSFDPHIVALTGTDDQIAAVVQRYRVYVSVHPANSRGEYMVDHNNYFYLVNPDGEFVGVLRGDLSGEEIADRLREMTKT